MFHMNNLKYFMKIEERCKQQMWISNEQKSLGEWAITVIFD